jgi:hypothetical protein
MTKFQLQANLVSIESYLNNKEQKLKATDIKEKKLTPDQEKFYENNMESLMKKISEAGGYISLHDNTSMTGYSTIDEFISSIEAHSAKINKNFDIIIIDNVDSLNTLQGEYGKDEMGKLNSFITKLDAFSKTYMDGYGTTIVLLSQVNREGINKLKVLENNNFQDINIDATVLQKYSALYERATMVLVLYSSQKLRGDNQLKLIPVKLRNKPLPQNALTLTTIWDYSYVGGFNNLEKMKNDNYHKMVQQHYDNSDDLFDIELSLD